MNEIKEYLSSVKKRLEIILDLATYLPAKTPFFWGDEVITRLSDQDRETFKSYLSAARQNQENVTECKKTIGKRLDYCIKQAASVEPPADETPLLMVYGLFDETLRLSALAMQSVALSDRIARLLEKYSDEEKTAAARQYQDEAVKAILDAIREEGTATRGNAGPLFPNVYALLWIWQRPKKPTGKIFLYQGMKTRYGLKFQTG